MKKIISLALALVMVLTLGAVFASCGEKANDGKVAYVLCEKGDTYSLGLGASFTTAFEALGGTVINEQFPAGTTNFTDYLQKAIDKNAAVIFAPNSTTVAANLIPQAKEAGITCPIMAGDTWESSVILDAAKNTGLDVYCSTFFDETDTTSNTAATFVNGFKAWLNANADKKTMNGGNDIVAAVSALGFDAYNTAMVAIRAAAAAKGADMTSIDVATALWATDITNAVTGTIKFDQNGDAIKDSAYIKKAAADGSKFEFVKTQTVTNNATKGTAVAYTGTGVSIDKTGKKIIVGVYEPQSGANAAGGKQEILGIQYANSLDNKVTIGSEEYTVVLEIADNGSESATGVTAAANLVSKNAIVVLGSYGSGVSMAAAPTLKAACIPAIGISCTNASVTEGQDYYFRTCFLDPFQGGVMADFAWSVINK